MNVEIPVNTHALVYFPTQSRDKILEDGKKIKYKVVKMEGERLVLRLGSGNYSFWVQP